MEDETLKTPEMKEQDLGSNKLKHPRDRSTERRPRNRGGGEVYLRSHSWF